MSWGGWRTGKLAARRQLRPGILLGATLALSVGAAMTGLTAYSVLNRETRASFMQSRPPHAVLDLVAGDAEALSRGISAVVAHSDVEAIERREVLIAEVEGDDGGWRPVFVFEVQDPNAMDVATIEAPYAEPTTDGPWVWLERSAVPLLGSSATQELGLRRGSGPEVVVAVSDLVWDAGTAPGWMDGLAHAYTDPAGFAAVRRALGVADQPPTTARLLVRFAPTPDDVDAVREHIDRIEPVLTSAGVRLADADVPPVEEHPHESQYQALVFTLAALTGGGALVGLALSLFVFRIWFEQHGASVGVMRALGGGTRHASLFALRLMAPSAVVGGAAGLALGWSFGRGFVGMAAPILNVEIRNGSPTVLAWTLALVGIVALCGVLLVSSLARTLTIPVADTLRTSAHAAPSTGWVAKVGGFLPFAALWPLRATLRAPMSLLLATGFIGAAGASFVAAGNVSESWVRTLSASANAQRSDGFVGLEPIPAAELERILDGVVELEAYEVRRSTFALVGSPGSEPTERVSVVGVVRGALDPPDIERGVRGGAEASVVLNHRLARFTATGVGDELQTIVGGEPKAWRVGGIVTEYTPALRMYAPAELIGTTSQREVDQASGFVFRLAGAPPQDPMTDDPAQWEDLRRALDRAGLPVWGISSTRAASRSIVDHVRILWAALLFSSVVLAGLGVVGLGVALALSVTERRTEFGVLRAIGIQPGTLALGVVGQSLLVCLLGAALGIAMSDPVATWAGNQSGQLFVQADLLQARDGRSIGLWIVLVVASALIAATPSALKATRITVREAFDK